MIEFLKSTKIDKGWGYEEILINRPEFCSKILHYNKRGAKSSFHFHPIKKECFKILCGTFSLSEKNERGQTQMTKLVKDDLIYIPNFASHQLICLEDDSEILEISTSHSDLDVIRIEPGDSQK